MDILIVEDDEVGILSKEYASDSSKTEDPG